MKSNRCMLRLLRQSSSSFLLLTQIRHQSSLALVYPTMLLSELPFLVCTSVRSLQSVSDTRDSLGIWALFLSALFLLNFLRKTFRLQSCLRENHQALSELTRLSYRLCQNLALSQSSPLVRLWINRKPYQYISRASQYSSQRVQFLNWLPWWRLDHSVPWPSSSSTQNPTS